jgi:hypothetical protein
MTMTDIEATAVSIDFEKDSIPFYSEVIGVVLKQEILE